MLREAGQSMNEVQDARVLREGRSPFSKVLEETPANQQDTSSCQPEVTPAGGKMNEVLDSTDLQMCEEVEHDLVQTMLECQLCRERGELHPTVLQTELQVDDVLLEEGGGTNALREP